MTSAAALASTISSRAVPVLSSAAWSMSIISICMRTKTSSRPRAKLTTRNVLGYLGTANGRIGYAFDRVLVYATGGLAFGEVHSSVNINGGPAYAGTYNNTKTGYDVGGGLEYAIPTDSFLNYLSVEKILGIDKKLGLDAFDGTIRAEYIHYDLGTETVCRHRCRCARFLPQHLQNSG